MMLAISKRFVCGVTQGKQGKKMDFEQIKITRQERIEDRYSLNPRTEPILMTIATNPCETRLSSDPRNAHRLRGMGDRFSENGSGC
jgi:hypothetical protein